MSEQEARPVWDPVRLASHVASLIASPAYAEAIARSEDELARAWGATAPEEAGRREQLYHELAALRRIKAALNRMVTDGNATTHRAQTRS